MGAVSGARQQCVGIQLTCGPFRPRHQRKAHVHARRVVDEFRQRGHANAPQPWVAVGARGTDHC